MLKLAMIWNSLKQTPKKLRQAMRTVPETTWMRTIAWAAALALVVPTGFHIYWFPWGFAENAEAWAHFGDFFGGVVGTWFVIIGSAFVYRTYVLQKRATDQSSFETTFFHLIAFHHNLVERLRPTKPLPNPNYVKFEPEKPETGIAELMRFKKECDDWIGPRIGRYVKTQDGEAIVTSVAEDFAHLYETHFFHLGHYFRHLYWIFRFVDDSSLPRPSKEKYAKIVRAQLSPEEVILIGLNGITEHGKKFKSFIEEYRLLHPAHPGSEYYKVFENAYNPAAIADESHGSD